MIREKNGETRTRKFRTAGWLRLKKKTKNKDIDEEIEECQEKVEHLGY